MARSRVSLLNVEMSFATMTKFYFIPKAGTYNRSLGSVSLETRKRQGLVNQYHLEFIRIISISPSPFLSLCLPASVLYIPVIQR